MKGNSSSGYDESMKVVREPREKWADGNFFFREKLGKGGIMEGAVLAEFSGKMIVNTGNLQ